VFPLWGFLHFEQQWVPSVPLSFLVEELQPKREYEEE